MACNIFLMGFVWHVCYSHLHSRERTAVSCLHPADLKGLPPFPPFLQGQELCLYYDVSYQKEESYVQEESFFILFFKMVWLQI